MSSRYNGNRKVKNICYNMKEKDATELLGHLEYCQESGFGSMNKITHFSEKEVFLLSPFESNYMDRTFFVEETFVKHETILSITKAWVNKVMAGMGVCPFTVDENNAGVPRGKILYSISDAVHPEQAFQAFWDNVSAMLSVEISEASTVLLVFPQPRCEDERSSNSKYSPSFIQSFTFPLF